MTLSISAVHPPEAAEERRGTGVIFLVGLLLFFGTVFAVNGALVYYAVTTFSGEQEASPYEHGLAYDKDIAAAREQDARGWKVTLSAARREAGTPASIALTLHDRDDAPLQGLDVTATLEFPTDKKLDRRVTLLETGAGDYAAEVPAREGRWDVVIEARRGGERLFRSRNRVNLP
jgi:nitrogen fixation protein FixH